MKKQFQKTPLQKINIIKNALFIFVMAICFNINAQSNNNVNDSKVDCDPSLWKHVYNKERLEIQPQGCITVKGVVKGFRPANNKSTEPDGDKHILLKLDIGQEGLLNDKNISKEDGCLVIEPVCINSTPTQEDAKTACKDYVNTIYIPKVGEHVSVTGCYVHDNQHGHMEIHPVTKIVKLNK